DALLATLQAAADAYDGWREQGLRAQPAGDRLLLPVRPILYGGDDLTFVCHGRLGLALAERYLRAFAAAPASDGQPLSACAGVAIVHSRAPFSRAYGLADELCRTAKGVARAR